MTRILPLLLCALLLAAAPRPTGQPAWHRSAYRIARTCSDALSAARERSHALFAAARVPSFESVVLPLENMTADLHDATAVDRFLWEVSPESRVRAASLACRDGVASFLHGLVSEPRLYAALLHSQRRGSSGWNRAHRALAVRWLSRARRAGAGSAPARRAELQQRRAELHAVVRRLARKLHDTAPRTFEIGPQQAKALPPGFAATLHKNAAGYAIPVSAWSARTFMRYEPDARLRRAFYLACEPRATAAETNLAERAIALRDRIAHLLGYETWDDYRLAARMPQMPDRVFKLLNELGVALMPEARAELASLTALKAEGTANPAARLEPWDILYYDRIAKSTRYPAASGALRDYFPAAHTLAAALNLFHGMFGVDFTLLPAARGWNRGVTAYAVTDAADGRLLGTTYFELHALPATRERFTYVTILPARKLPGEGYRPEITAILGDVPAPVPGKPSFLRHADLVRLFGALGRNLAALLSTAPYETLAAIADREMSAAPAQLFEDYAWQPSVLESIGSDPQTGASPPAALVDAAIGQSRVDRPLFTTYRIFATTLELEYQMHGPIVDTAALRRRVRRATTPLPAMPGTQAQASFALLVESDGVGLYERLWSRLYAQEMFGTFVRDGLTNAVTGMRLRRDVLEPVGILDPRLAIEHFTGHRLTLAPYYDYLGISTGAYR